MEQSSQAKNGRGSAISEIRRVVGLIGFLEAMGRLPAIRAAVVCLLLCGTVAGCASAGRSEADCVPPALRAEPERVVPAETFRLRGENFFVGCNDTRRVPGKEPGEVRPDRKVAIDFRQDGRVWSLTTVDADSDYAFGATLRVPAEAEPGRAVVTATAGSGKTEERLRVAAG